MTEYIEKVKGNLFCNSSEADKKEFYLYEYNNEDIDNNRDYFERCSKDGLSPYKALLYFNDHLNLNQ